MSDVPAELAATAGNGEAPLLLTIDEVCGALKISRWSLYQLINKRRLRTLKIGARRFITPGDLYAFVDELRTEGGE